MKYLDIRIIDRHLSWNVQLIESYSIFILNHI